MPALRYDRKRDWSFAALVALLASVLLVSCSSPSASHPASRSRYPDTSYGSPDPNAIASDAGCTGTEDDYGPVNQGFDDDTSDAVWCFVAGDNTTEAKVHITVECFQSQVGVENYIAYARKYSRLPGDEINYDGMIQGPKFVITVVHTDESTPTTAAIAQRVGGTVIPN